MPRHHSEMVRLGWTAHLGNAVNLVSLRLFGRYPIRVQVELEEAMHAFGRALSLTGYEDPTDYVGSYMYRTIGNAGKVWSEHAYGVAVDWDYGGDTDGDGDPTIDKNPHIHRPIVSGDPGFGVEWQLTERDVRAIEGIKNTYGEQMWGWLGWKIGDTMHFATKVRPDRTRVDWSTVGDGDDEDMVNLLTDATWMSMFHEGVPGVVGFGRYYCSNDGTYNWAVDLLEGLNAPWGSNPHWNEQTQRGAKDGGHQSGERVHAFNYLLQGFSRAAGGGNL